MQNRSLKSITVLFIGFAFLVLTAQAAFDPLAEQKSELMKTLEKRYIVKDDRIISAVINAAREDFLPELMKKYSYVDISLPLDNMNIIISHSDILKAILSLKKSDSEKALIIGRNGGFSAAVLSSLYESVYLIESNRAEEEKYKAVFPGKYTNISTAFTDNYNYFDTSGPFDLVLINGWISKFSGDYINLLKEDGQIIFPLKDNDGFQLLYRGERAGETYDIEVIGEVIYPAFSR